MDSQGRATSIFTVQFMNHFTLCEKCANIYSLGSFLYSLARLSNTPVGPLMVSVHRSEI